MLEEHYPFVAQPLPYEYDALLPVLDEETLHFHHDKHYQTYVDKLKAELADTMAMCGVHSVGEIDRSCVRY